MGSVTIRICAVLAIAMSVLGGCRQEASKNAGSVPALPATQSMEKGEALFKQYCSPCHPDGGNVSNPERTLHRSDLEANRLTRPQDIVRIMRNPISRMIRFDTATLSDQDAMTIAEYVLTTFR
jgi:cytochrome c6